MVNKRHRQERNHKTMLHKVLTLCKHIKLGRQDYQTKDKTVNLQTLT